MRKSFTTVLGRDGPGFFIILPFDPKPIFGKVRAPVKVTVNGYTYRSTVSAMAECSAFRCARAIARWRALKIRKSYR